MSETAIILKYRSSTSRSAKAAATKKLITGALESLKVVPNLKLEQIGAIGTPDHPDFSIVITFGQRKFKVAGEVKPSGEPSVLRRSAAWLKDLVTKTKHDYALIIAPFISKEGAAICCDLGIGFIDLSGNCLLSLQGLYIERTGYPNKFKKPREIKSLFSPKSSQVIRCLLSDPARTWTLKGLATETGVSIGLIHRIATALENDLFAKKERRAFKLEDPARLLEAWREEYTRRAPKWARYIAKVGSIEELVIKLKTASIHHGVRYALTGPSGASLIFPYLNPTMVQLYVDVLRREFLDGLGVDAVPSEGNLLIRVVEQENEFIGSRQVKGIYVVSDIQLYLDLWAMGGRGQEAAEELRRERLHI